MVVRVTVITLGAALVIAGAYFGYAFYASGAFSKMFDNTLYAFA